MTGEPMLAAWAARNLPARVGVSATAQLLGFAEHDIQILMALGKLTPLGDPAPNAPKWFSAIEVIRLVTDHDWLHKATKEVSKYWRNKRERRQGGAPAACHHGIEFRTGKISPDSSPNRQFEGVDGAMAGGRRVAEHVD